ncbi:carbon-nitrogen hydrolase [Xylona heveae TC161]|uniref:Carbon-nitrogen hydrolase n=1 Tax=Xylona heveae (strain CBS 132557 / TC161) TaxID=1328760 RepID=A0A161TPJ4_XYLHT|nr:carbon-nitrogen hydrolase [Xylona heveae TC161]KZF24136.1 carbon-nitrogen hydrolase [Xylona heveae TC161]
MPQKLKLAVAQAHTLSDPASTLFKLAEITRRAASAGVHLILFPEAYLGGYPRTCSFGSAVGSRDPIGREQYLHYFHDAIDLGDTPVGAGNRWVEKQLPIGKDGKPRGDGTREQLEKISRDTGVFIVVGLVERAAGSLYCSAVYICPREGMIGKRRKVMPTGSERIVWAQGSPSTLKAITTNIAGVKLTIGTAICWENYMPLLRQTLYAQNINLYLAPTADARDTWLPLLRTIGCEGRAFVLSSNQCVRKKHLPHWITGTSSDSSGGAARNGIERRVGQRRRSSIVTKTKEDHEISWPPPHGSLDEHDARQTASVDEALGSAISSADDGTAKMPEQDTFVCRGGSSIVSPMGEVLAGPLWEAEEDFLAVEVDFEDCERGRLDFDAAGSYSRNDAFQLTVQGLDLDPPA